jgi:hypothetical protein
MATAQEGTPGFGIEANLAAGKVIKHTPKFTLPIPELSTAAEVHFLWKTYGKKEWQRTRHYPQVGLGITYTNYGNTDVYGHVLGIYPTLELPLIRTQHWEWSLRLGMGLGYATERFSRLGPNPDTVNVAIGSHINNFTLFSTDIRYKINKHWDIQAGVNFSHISDAAFRKPNLGINMAGGHIGLRYFPVTSEPKLNHDAVKKMPGRFLLQARAGIAMNSAGSGNGPLSPVYLGTVYLSRRYHGNNKVFAGVDYQYNTGIYSFLRNYEIFPGDEFQHTWQGGVYIGNEFMFGCAGLVFLVGTYVHQAYLKIAPVYEKLGINWYVLRQEKGLFKEVYIATLLKTHMTQAELAELGLGVGF